MPGAREIMRFALRASAVLLHALPLPLHHFGRVDVLVVFASVETNMSARRHFVHGKCCK